MRFKPLTLVVGLALTLIVAVAAHAADYFTDLEIDRIRETQEIDRRVNVFLEIAEVRLAYLGLVEAEEETQENGTAERVQRLFVRIFAPGVARDIERVEAEQQGPDFDHDVSQFSRSDLLGGYNQALDEAMDNIDDAYERKRGDVRPALEALKVFTEETIPLLERFSPENLAEETALEKAIDQARTAQAGAEGALEFIPKTVQ